ncbi:MAG TPA: hypothetical protein VET45_20215 [Candidatus Binatia bacterium]|nr:hypothetical protein [Candidatus Binatia bacterium]
MIIHLNFLPKPGDTGAGEVVAALFALLDQGRIDPELLPRLRLHLDWLQYKANFREPVTVRHAADARGERMALAELAIDVRRARPERLIADLGAAVASLGVDTREADGRVGLEDWAPLGASLIWQFNRLFWQRLADWERVAGRGFEAALPSGRSDANDPAAVADAVADFWTLLVELDKRGQLPPEIFALEIGVGTGTRAGLWLDRFKAIDEARATGFYPRLRFLLADYSLPALDRAMSAVDAHRDVVSMIATDALNPLRALSFLRYKILYVHLTNVYDNLPVDELVRRDGQLYLLETRAYLPAAAAAAVARTSGVGPSEQRATVARLLETGPDLFGDRARGVAFWRAVWDGLCLEERLRRLEGAADVPLPPGLHGDDLDELLAAAPADVRFHISRGAVESFVNTVPLLHPRGYLQVQDIFVAAMDEYRQGFRGPGKLDGSVVNWVNGALLRAVGARAGYDVHFAPFRYRAGSRTSILYTTLRE